MKKPERTKIAFKVALMLMAVVLIALPLFSPFGFADPASDLSNAQNNYNNKQSEIKNIQSQIEEGKRNMQRLQGEIKSYENQIYQTQNEINELAADLNESRERVKQVLAELDEIEKRLEVQNTALMERLRAMYKNGDIGMISVLFGSSDMSDLITNVEMMRKVYELDENVLAQIEEQHVEITKKKDELVALKEKLEAQQAALDTKKATLQSSMVYVEQLRNQVEADNAMLAAQLETMKREADALKAEIIKLQSSIAYAGGAMCWPAASSAYITSPFGNRFLFGYWAFHTGIDIGAAWGTNILAANSGKVIRAAYNAGGYGYYVMIDHGGGIVTLYAHSSRLLVNVGDYVKKGQVIALIGSTGMSTGPHLHFEVRVNGDYKNPINYVTQGRYYYD